MHHRRGRDRVGGQGAKQGMGHLWRAVAPLQANRISLHYICLHDYKYVYIYIYIYIYDYVLFYGYYH